MQEVCTENRTVEIVLAPGSKLRIFLFKLAHNLHENRIPRTLVDLTGIDKSPCCIPVDCDLNSSPVIPWQLFNRSLELILHELVYKESLFRLQDVQPVAAALGGTKTR